MENFEKMTIGQRLRHMIDARQFTQVSLAKQVGITQAAISNIVTDSSRKPSAPTLLKLAGALQCSPEWLITGVGDPFQSNTLGERSEQELVELYRRAPNNLKESILSMLRALTPQ